MENRTRIAGKFEPSPRSMSPPSQTNRHAKLPNWWTVRCVLFAILCTSIPHAALAEVPLVNPSFETPLLAEGQFLTPMPASAGWQTRGAVTLMNGGVALAASPWRVEAPMGRQWIGMRPGNLISQNVNLSAGTYFVSLQAMQTPNSPAVAALRVKLGGTTVATISPTSDVTKLTFATITIASMGLYQLTIDIPEPTPGTAVPAGAYLDDIVLNQQGVNSKPSVAVTYPQPGQTFSALWTTDVQATALDHDGSITKVEFYDGATLLGTSFAAPWKFALNMTTSLSRAITAKAYDNTGATNTSDVTNFSHHTGGAFPYVANGTFENPTYMAAGGADAGGGAYNASSWSTQNAWVATSGFVGAGYTMPAPLQGRQALFFTMQYEGGSASQTVNLPAGSYGLSLRTRVNFFQELRVNVPGGVATIAHGDNYTSGITGKFYIPFTHTGGATSIGLQALKPYYNSSYAPITVDDIVIGPAGTATVSMMMPASGDTYTTPAAIPLQATVATYDRDVAKVEYFDGPVLIGTVTTTPYLFDWLNVRAGTHSITAKVTDSLGKTATSAPVSVTVNTGTPNPAFFNAGFERGMASGGYLGTTGWGWYSPPGLLTYAAGNRFSWIASSPPAPEGVGVALLNGYAAMMQEVEFPVGTYKISFKAAQQSASGTVAMRVKVNGADVGSFTPTAAFGTYTTNAFAISAAGLKTVRFEGMSPGNTAFILLDDLSIASFTPGGGDVVVPNDPPATVSASAGLTYASQAFGTLSATQNITITNTGSVVATVIPPVVATNDFIPVSTCPGQLGAGQSCVVTVTFVPNASGNRNDSVVIGGSSGTTLTTVAVSGTGDLGIVFGGNGTTATGGTNVEDKNVGGSLSVLNLSDLNFGSFDNPPPQPIPGGDITARRLPTIQWWEYMDLLWALDRLPYIPAPPEVVDPKCEDAAGGGTDEPGGAEFANPTSDIGVNLPPTDPTYTADPIHAGLGNKSHPQIDYAAKGGFPLAFIRTYQAQATNAAALARQKLGPGWYGNWDKSVNITAGGTPARITRGDGSSIVFNKQSNGTWTPITSDIVATLTTVLNGMVENGWTHKIGNKTENYNATGRLTSVTLSTGENYLVEYDTSARLKTVKDPSNRILTFNYDAKGRLANIVDPSMLVTSYTYDDSNANPLDRLGRVTSVTFPDNRARRYKYEDSVRKFALTSIATFENNVETLYATFSYDQSNGRAMGNSFGTSANEAQRSGRAAVYYETGTNSVSYDPSRVVRDAQGNFNLITAGQYPSYATVKRQFTTILGSVLPTWIQYTHICAGCPDITESFSYDANARLVSQTDRRGIITAYTYTPDGRGLVATTTQAAGTQIARTVTTTWHPTLRVPTQVVEPTRTTNYTYDTGGRMLTRSVAAMGQPTRTTTNVYNAGKLQSSTDPLNNTTTYTYFDMVQMCVPCRGLVNTITNPKGHVTTYNSYDANGNPTSISNANGTTSTFTYDPRGRLITKTDGGLTTTYTYTTNGQINTITDPYGAVTTHLYDDALRLYGKDQSNGEKIRYTLDNAGRTTQTQTFDAGNTLSTTSSTVYDGLNRVLQTINASGKITNYTYDANGNVTTVVDPNNLTTSTQYDALNRPILVTDPNLKTIATSYTPDDKVAAVIDPNSNTTSYTYNGFGEQTTIQSPDTGGTTMTYNAGGLIATKLDARGKTTTYTYDVLNRVTSVVYNDGNIAQTYDVGTSGVGRLSSVTDLSGSTTYTYDSVGRVASKTSFITGVPSNRTITYGRDSLGRVTTITYPGGNVVGMTYTQGRVTNMTLNGAALISAIDYFPLGGPESWLLGPNAGTSAIYMRYIDLNSRIEKYNTPSGYRKLAFDNASRITGMGDYLGTNTTPSATQTFGYDNVGRLASFTGYTSNGNAQANITQTQTFTYDNNGNRLTSVLNGTNSTYVYQTGNNRLASVTGGISKTNVYDLSGNLTNDGSATMTYDARGRMITANASGLSTSYLINYQNLRVKKSNTSETRYFVYDDAGHMMGEYDAAGAVVAEYFWLGDTMVAVKGTMPCLSGGTCTETATAYVWADHLNTPRELTRINGSNQHVSIWKWDSLPFGETTPNANPSNLGVMTFNHRFPGQYRDSETGLHQNWNREYDPRLGRYITSDPIGLQAGTNTFGYANQNSISFIDPNGQCAIAAAAAAEIALQLKIALGIVVPIAGVVVGVDNQSIAAIAGNIAGGASNIGTSYLVVTTAAGSATAITAMVIVTAGVGGMQIGNAINNLPTGGGKTVYDRISNLIQAAKCAGKCN